MNFNINDVSRGTVSKFAIGLLSCLLTSYNVSLAVHGDTTTGGLIIISLAGIIIVGCLIWFFKLYLSGKRIPTIPHKPGVVSEIINWILFSIWVLSEYFFKTSPLWVIGAWCLYAVSSVYCLVYIYKNGSEA